jgi:hypothetical protein
MLFPKMLKLSIDCAPVFSSKFNPNLYRPVIVSPRPRIMQVRVCSVDFIKNISWSVIATTRSQVRGL